MAEYIGGLDIGTTGCKVTVFDTAGNPLGNSYRAYSHRPENGEHVMDASMLLDAVFDVIRETAARFPQLKGFGVTSFGESFVMTDENGIPLAPVMLYTDPRGNEECRELEDKFGSDNFLSCSESKYSAGIDSAPANTYTSAAADGVSLDSTYAAPLADADVKNRRLRGSHRIEEIAGVRPHEMYSLPKLMWMKKHRPEIFAKTRHVFLMEDFVVWSLTGNAQIDYSLATRTMGFDIRSLCWSREIFDTAGIDPSLFSKPVPTGTSAGTVTAEIAKKTGLSPDTIIISISHDQVAAAVGAGVFSPDTAVDGAGTVECLTPVYDQIPDMSTMYDGSYAVVPYVIPGTYVCYAFSYTGGALIQWCTDTLAQKAKELAAQHGISVNEYLEQAYLQECQAATGDTRLSGSAAADSSCCYTDSSAQTTQIFTDERTSSTAEGADAGTPAQTLAEKPSGLLVLPHFAGAATPYMDTGSKGAILGLTTGTTLADIYRGCMEGVVYEMLLNQEHLTPSGIRYKSLHATGGGAKSAVWMQMKADILNVPVTALRTVNAGTVGSAMLTGIALGIYGNLPEAADVMITKAQTYAPRPKMHEKYMQVYARYKNLYDAVRPLM